MIHRKDYVTKIEDFYQKKTMFDSEGQDAINKQFKELRKIQNLIAIVEEIMIKPRYKFPLIDLDDRPMRY